MALFKKKEKPKKQEVKAPEQYEKLSLFITIVNRGQGNFVVNLFKENGSNMQLVQLGEGTAQKEIRDILGIEDNSKEIVLALICNDRIENAKKQLLAYFRVSKRNKGVGFSIPLKSLIGMKIYQFLTDSIYKGV